MDMVFINSVWHFVVAFFHGFIRDAHCEVSLLSEATLLAFYILCSRFVMRKLAGVTRDAILAFLNIAGLFYFIVYLTNDSFVSVFLFYVFLVLVMYLMFRFLSDGVGWLPWLAFFTPILVLVVIRYMPDHFFDFRWHAVPRLVGISYLCFRCSRLVLEVRNGSVTKPGFCRYMNYAFFLPTMSVGPINTYANFERGFGSVPWDVPIGRAVLRVLVGWVKFQFLGGMLAQLGYSVFLRNGHLHPWIHLPVAMVFYFLFLYCNFSGFCDMAIGSAALIGIPVGENFNNPFVARNMKEFWNRWHISLSEWMRDIVFAPLSKWLVRILGPTKVNHAIALTILFVFMMLGVWHGVGWNYAVFGAFQALGVVVVHYYTIGLKRWLGRDRFKAYNQSRVIYCFAVVITFCYYAASLMFFANTLTEVKGLLAVLR